ncbi:MAG TPA: phospholipase D family protein [Steroidobacteraceae bacterium]|nr:phospholipase D family protein [Steroidobacteraceae bacterium]
MYVPAAVPLGGDSQRPGLASAIGPAEFGARPGKSACLLLDTGPTALLLRSVLADEARRSIDLQTYLYDDDEAGIVLMDRLRAAAERGVQVRLLIDDNGLRTDECLPLLLDSLPNAEVRVFNPFRLRPRWTRPLQVPFEFRRLNHRMHNKLYVVDGHATIIGGRNIGGHYFEANAAANFTDLDVLLLGPVARDAQQVFEQYWSSDLAVPLPAAMGRRDSSMARERIERYVRAARFMRLQEMYRHPDRSLRDALARVDSRVHWVASRIVVDDPRKACVRRRAHAPQVMVDALNETWERAREEVLAATAYFVPGRKGAGDLIRLRRRGVHVRILTNSLASNDVPAVHAGYTRYRRALLRAGVELYEYQRFGNRPRHHHGASSSNALHAKTIVVDRRLAWVGSFNLDPRSSRLNTEMAVLLESESLARDLAARMERDLAPDRSWHVMMRRGTRELRWLGEKDGRPLEHRHEPDSSWLLRSWVRLARQLPHIERFL